MALRTPEGAEGPKVERDPRVKLFLEPGGASEEKTKHLAKS